MELHSLQRVLQDRRSFLDRLSIGPKLHYFAPAGRMLKFRGLKSAGLSLNFPAIPRSRNSAVPGEGVSRAE